MAAAIDASRKAKDMPIGTGEAYDAYKAVCGRTSLHPLSGRAFGDLLGGLDMYSLLRCRVLSKGRYGRTREITVDLPAELTEGIHETIAMQLGL